MTAGNISAGTLETSGDVDIGSNLKVDGLSEFTGDMTAGNISAGTLEISGSVNITGALSVTTSIEFIGDMTAGNISASTLETSGTVDIAGDLNVTGLSTLEEVDIKLGNINNTIIGATTPTSASVTDLTATSIDIINAGTLKFKELTTAGPAYVGLKAPDEIDTSYTLTLPDELGIDGNILALNTLDNRLEFISADLFGGGTINVSIENGHDANDGINKPVKTIKRGLQIASGFVYDEDGNPNGKKLVVSVANGEYYEDNPIIIPDNVSVQGAGLRACNIRPLNANLDMLRVRNGCYFTGFTFRDSLNVSGIPQFKFDYAVSFDDPTDLNCDRTDYDNLPDTRPSITISPYIQNCSIISFLGANGVLVDGNKVNAPNKPKNAIEVENPEEGPVPEQGKSMVANAFTMLSFGGTGWRVINDAYAQIVSCFQIFCLNGSYCQSGGYLSITNSATNFGKYALRASGYSPNAFSFNRGVVIGTGSTGIQQTIQAIGFGQLPVQDYVLRFRSNAYKNAYLDLLENKNDLQSKVITWIDAQRAGGISPFTNSFTYDETLCLRDVGLVIDAVANDVLTGGNSRSVEAGLSYANADLATLTAQKTQNIAAFNYLKTQALLVVAGLGIDPIVADKFKIITDIINDPTTAPVSVSFSNLGDITANYQDIDPTIDYVNFNSVTDVNFVTNVFNVTGHGLLNGQKVIYNNNSNPTIPGLNHEQTYYVDFRSNDQFGLFYDDSLTLKVNILSNSTGQQRFIKNVKEFYVDTLIDSHTEYQKLILNAFPGVTYKFETGRVITGTTGGKPNRAYVYSYNTLTKELIVSIDYTTVGNVRERRLFNSSSIISSDHSTSPRLNINILSNPQPINTLYTVDIKILPVTTGTSLTNLGDLLQQQIWLHRPSIVNSSSHSWEYAGSGTDYNALPQNGGKGDPFYEQVSDLPGKVYTSGTNELGDFKVGNFIKAENKTGNVTFTNTVTIGALAALRLAVGNITVEEFSSDFTLGDAEAGGPKATRLSTQLAIRGFLENRLGDFIDKKVSTNNLAGAIPQLNSSGQLSSDLIPPIRTFISHRSQGHRSRLLLAERIPAVNILIGDISTEIYSTVELTLDEPITASDGTIVIQDGTGAKGVIVENVSSTTVITVSSYLDSVFNHAFDTTGALTIGGDSTPSNTNTSVKPDLVGDVQLDQNTNYTLSEAEPSQFLVLDPLENYDFTGITSVTGVNTQAIGTITGTKYGVAYTLDNANLDGGSGYNSDITGYTVFKNIALTSITGSGTGARADITVTNGEVTNIYLLEGGSGYAVNNLLRADYNDIGGTYTTQFSIRITSIQKRLYVNIVGSQKFQASIAVPELISDANSLVKTINLTTTTALTFSAESTDDDVDYINSRITIPNHGLKDGDPIKYNLSPSDVSIGGLVDETVYYVRLWDNDTIELSDNYSIQNKITFISPGTGNQSLTLSSIDLIDNTVYLPNHGFNTGDAVYLTGTTLPVSIPSGNFYFIGSVTTNSFTLHQSKSKALASIGGQTVEDINLVSTGSGTADFKLQNIKIIDTINTSSKSIPNWSRLSINPIDANNIISGIINPSRLAIGAASSDSFLRGDRTWVKTIQTLKVESGNPLSLIGSFTTDGTVKSYYGDVKLEIDTVAGDKGDQFYSNLGVVRLRKSQFEIGTKDDGTLGNVYIKNNVIDAGTVGTYNSNYLLDSVNHSLQPVNKGGTGLAGYTQGDILYANGPESFGILNIGSANKVMVSTGSAPNWSDNINLKGLTVNGNVNLEGGIVSINSGIVKIADKNIEVGAVSALSSLTGVIADVDNPTSVTGMTSTAGITAGMVLTKVSGTGVFGPNARVVEVLNNNTIRVDADGSNTTGDITFNLGGATDDTANDGGIIVKGLTDKKLFWNKNSLSWTSSENMNLAVNKEYKINTTTVLSSTQVLGKGFTSSAGEIVTSGSYWARTFAFMGV